MLSSFQRRKQKVTLAKKKVMPTQMTEAHSTASASTGPVLISRCLEFLHLAELNFTCIHKQLHSNLTLCSVHHKSTIFFCSYKFKHDLFIDWLLIDWLIFLFILYSNISPLLPVPAHTVPIPIPVPFSSEKPSYPVSPPPPTTMVIHIPSDYLTGKFV